MTSMLPAKACCAPLAQVIDTSTSVVMTGSPNVGKSTLFNALTGSHVTVGNWPGTSVDVARGNWQLRDGVTTLIDLPGAYSLQPMSSDEEVTVGLLTAEDAPNVVIVTVDAANLARSLYLAVQLRQRPGKVVIALTMNDVAEARGITVNAVRLAELLGCPVVEIDPRRRSGMANLAEVVNSQFSAPEPKPLLQHVCADHDDCDLAGENERFTFIEQLLTEVETHSPAGVQFSDRMDDWVMRPVIGPLIFLAVMWAVLQLTTTVAAPFQDGLDALFSGPVSDGASWLLGVIGLGGSWVEGLVVDGIIAGVGMVLTFVPLMAIMFVLLALLEDSGYLARAAVLTDRTMRRMGLPGQAFMPIVVGFGCNVPAISATRILPDSRQRILTSLLVPFTSCTARLTVFLLLSSIFFGKWAGTVVFGLYLFSILLVVGTGILLRNTLWRTMGDTPLVMDLPPYQKPTVRVIAAVSWYRLKGFLQSAAGIIVVVVIAVWLLQSVPALGSGATFGDVEVADSIYGTISRFFTPLFAWTGFADWRIVSGLIVGFVAKEAVVSSWAQTFAVESSAVESDAVLALGDSLTNAFAASSGGHVAAAVLAFCVFQLAYTPCVATLGAQYREIGAKWTIFGMVVQLIFAWVLAVVVFQIGALIL